MPIQECQLDGLPGLQWGDQGTCYTYEPGDEEGRAEAKQKAIKQAIAAGEVDELSEEAPEMNDDTAPGFGWDDAQLHTAVLLAEDAAPDDGGTWVDVLLEGDTFSLFDGDERKASFTRADFKQIVANHAALMKVAGPSPVDANHATAMDRNGADTHLRAEIPEVRIHEPDEGPAVLQALFNWTALGMREIKDRLFRAISGEVARIKDKRTGDPIGLALVGATLCNRPFLSGLAAPTTLSELARADRAMGAQPEPPAVEEEDPMEDLITRLSEVHGEALTEDKIIELLGERTALSEQVETLTEERDGLNTQIATLTEASEADKGEIVALSERVGALEVDKRNAEEASTLDIDLRRGAVTKAEAGTADEPGVARKLWRKDVELYAEVYGERPDNYQGTAGKPKGHNEQAPKTGTPTTGLDSYDAVTVYLSEQFDKAENGADYTAWERAYLHDLNDNHDGEGDRLRRIIKEG